MTRNGMDLRRDVGAVVASASQRPLAEALELAAALRAAGDGGDADEVLVSAAPQSVAEVLEVAAALRVAGQRGAMDRLLESAARRRAADVLEFVAALRAAGEDDDADKVLGSVGGRSAADVVRLMPAVRSNERAQGVISGLLGTRARGWAERRHIARAMRRTGLDAAIWQPIMRQNSRKWTEGPTLALAWFVVVMAAAFLAGGVVSQLGTHPQLGLGNWAAVAASVVIVLCVAAAIRSAVFDSERRRYRTGRWQLILLVEAAVLVSAAFLAPHIGMAHLGFLLRNWLAWRF
jgi:hypothetical protein